MKKILLLLLLAFSIEGLQPAQAQSAFGSFFSQNKTYRKRLAEQIALLKVYKGYLDKGYDLVRDGMGTINAFKSGEFNLHDFFFKSLKAVNPQIRKYSRLPEVIQMQAAIIELHIRDFAKVKRSRLYSDDELLYLARVYGHLLEDCEQSITELMELLSADLWQLSDNERIARIDQLHGQVLEMYLFGKSFTDETLQLGNQRRREEQGLEMMLDWYKP